MIEKRKRAKSWPIPAIFGNTGISGSSPCLRVSVVDVQLFALEHEASVRTQAIARIAEIAKE
jgi:hypothetical protein